MGQSQLEEFLSGAANRHYRHLVEYHMGRMSTKRLQESVLGETVLLPQKLQPLVIDYIDETNSRFGYDRDFWAQATCRDAFEAFIDAAISIFPLDGVLESLEDALESENHELAFQLFQIPTLSFAYSASTQRKQRKLMGIRKGIFG